MKKHYQRRRRPISVDSLELDATRQWMADQGIPDLFTLMDRMQVETAEGRGAADPTVDSYGCLPNHQKESAR